MDVRWYEEDRGKAGFYTPGRSVGECAVFSTTVGVLIFQLVLPWFCYALLEVAYRPNAATDDDLCRLLLLITYCA
jgi:hypothetical protein